MKSNKSLSLLFAILIAAMTLPGYMFFESESGTPDKTYRWPDHFPYVEYSLNTDFSSFPADSEAVIHAVTKASDLWYIEGEAGFALGYKGNTATKQPFSPSEISCSSQTNLDFLQNRNSVYASGIPDADCTGKSCSFLWSCDNDILHFDIQLNEYDNRFSLEERNSIVSILAHEFGHAAGLNHCSPGDTVSRCSSEDPFSNPDQDSIMYRFNRTLTALSEDDTSGIQTLYGMFQSRFPKTGDYALSGDEIQSIAVLMTMQHEEKFDTPWYRQEQAQMVQDTFQFVNSGEINRTLEWVKVREYETGMTAIQYFNRLNSILKSNLSSINDLQLEYMKRNLSSGIVVMDDMLNKYVPDERTPSPGTFEHINTENYKLRNAIIDEQKRRGLQ